MYRFHNGGIVKIYAYIRRNRSLSSSCFRSEEIENFVQFPFKNNAANLFQSSVTAKA